MKKIKTYETVKGCEVSSKSDPFFVPNASVKRCLYLFQCQKCGAEYELKDLAEM